MLRGASRIPGRFFTGGEGADREEDTRALEFRQCCGQQRPLLVQSRPTVADGHGSSTGRARLLPSVSMARRLLWQQSARMGRGHHVWSLHVWRVEPLRRCSEGYFFSESDRGDRTRVFSSGIRHVGARLPAGLSLFPGSGFSSANAAVARDRHSTPNVPADASQAFTFSIC